MSTRKDIFETGLKIRSEVLGAAHVQKSLDNASEFLRPMQELVTEYCWGVVWARPDLDRRSRSLVNIALLTALNRGHELGAHVKGAIANGCSKTEIQEVLLQTAIYVGVPAALESFRIAEAALDSLAVTQPVDGKPGMEPTEQSEKQ